MPKISYFLYGPDRPLTPTDPSWQRPLPLSRNATIHHTAFDAKNPSLGDYFEAVTQFLNLDDGNALAQAVTAQTGNACHPDEIESITVTLEKHGAFYHPASVNVTTPSATTTFVVNVAVSDEGRRIIDREFQLLYKLDPSKSGPQRVIPAGYFQNRCGSHAWPMYLGQWFDDFHEFHITASTDSDPDPIVVWAPEPIYLNQLPHKKALCHEMVRILTDFYNPLTFEQIGPWHHAAGDFIVKVTADSLFAKLITVRDYRPSINAPSEKTAATILEGLLTFFIHLSVQMRLDRRDGTGDLVWAGEWAVIGTVNGFFEALLEKPDIDLLPMPLSTAWGLFLAQLPPKKLHEALETVTNLYPATTPENRLIRHHFSDHLHDLQKALDPITTLFK